MKNNHLTQSPLNKSFALIQSPPYKCFVIAWHRKIARGDILEAFNNFCNTTSSSTPLHVYDHSTYTQRFHMVSDSIPTFCYILMVILSNTAVLYCSCFESVISFRTHRIIPQHIIHAVDHTKWSQKQLLVVVIRFLLYVSLLPPPTLIYSLYYGFIKLTTFVIQRDLLNNLLNVSLRIQGSSGRKQGSSRGKWGPSRGNPRTSEKKIREKQQFF